ncbi:collagen-like protein [Microbacterium excoecariae]|uniref:collagen-like protein n=1 Tax=Microbacterium excoecariae TaxID=2715210 RepID=UPI00140A5ED4|nr:collagen-like protein [Microbacterium excoecariae]NHI16879.1 collagen-like protein [Microbacterium excoecariae]
MTTTELLDAKRRDVRRAVIGMIVALLLVIAGAGVWIADISQSRDRWRADADAAWIAHQTLSETYSELYDEYVRATGHLPGADTPSDATDTSNAQAAAPSVTGERGPAGPAGPAGPQGERGFRGFPGDDGEDGDDGETGSPGADGEAGAPGLPGLQGAQGEPGETGPTGLTGATGATGSTGATGPAGAQGDRGPAGPQGADGRGITALTCDDTGTWQVTYTDGTTEPAGTCITTITEDPE